MVSVKSILEHLPEQDKAVLRSQYLQAYFTVRTLFRAEESKQRV